MSATMSLPAKEALQRNDRYRPGTPSPMSKRPGNTVLPIRENGIAHPKPDSRFLPTRKAPERPPVTWSYYSGKVGESSYQLPLITERTTPSSPYPSALSSKMRPSSKLSDLPPRLSPLRFSNSSFTSIIEQYGTDLSAENGSPVNDSQYSTESEDKFPKTSSGATVSRLSRLSPPLEKLKKQMRSATTQSMNKIGTVTRLSASKLKSASLGHLHYDFSRPFSLPTRSGAGLKGKNVISKPQCDIWVDSCELSEEFVSASLIPGRRGREIGTGATATVKIMYKKGNPKHVAYAVKEFRGRSETETEEEYERKIKSEFSIANSLDHPNIVETVRLCTHAGRWNHVMEYCNQGDLFSLIPKKYLQLEDKLCLFKQLLQGVAYLHNNGIAHRDIKLENLLLTESGHLKITDFGVAEVFSGIHPGLRSISDTIDDQTGQIRKCAPGICGSYPYIAPEVLARDGEYDPRPLDIWSCAIVCVALLSGGTPWEVAERKDPKYARFLEGWEKFYQEKPNGVVANYDLPSCGIVFTVIPRLGLRRLILQMLHPDPLKRATINDVLHDRWARKIDCCNPVSVPKVSKRDSWEPYKVHNHCPPVKKGIFNYH